jgi:hypothetical protein
MNDTVHVTPFFTRVYTVTGSNATGCAGTSATVTVIVNQTPIVSVSGAQSICSGQGTTLTASGANNYNWSTGATTAAITVSPSSTITYTVTGTSNNGCSSSIPVVVTVISVPSVSVSGTETICAGQTTTITASGASTYYWSTTATTASVVLSPTITTTYSVIGSNGGGCNAEVPVTITVNQGPVIGVVGIESICVGQTTTLTASGADNYTWSPGGITTASIVVSPSVTTVYNITGLVSTGMCTLGYALAEVVVNQPPTITLDPTGTVCSGSVYQINAGVSAGSTYTWSPYLSGLTPLVSTTSNTSYTLTASSGACQASASITIIPVTCTAPSCTNCLGSFSPEPGKKYLFTAWVKEAGALPTTTTYTNGQIYIDFLSLGTTIGPYYASGMIIDGWQRIEQVFFIPTAAADIKVRMQSVSGNSYFDDVRIFPFDGSVKSYVYDPVSRRLVAELDERNYATLYEYDEEGKLVRIKKETELGIMTVQESKSKSKKQ